MAGVTRATGKHVTTAANPKAAHLFVVVWQGFMKAFGVVGIFLDLSSDQAFKINKIICPWGPLRQEDVTETYDLSGNRVRVPRCPAK